MGGFSDINRYGGNRAQFLQGEPEGELVPYKHQIGAQGASFGVINKLLKVIVPSAEIRQKLLWFGNSTLFFVCMLFFSIWIYKEMGFWASVFSFTTVLFSQWATISMSNLYWVTWTLILPMILTSYACEAYEKKDGKIVYTWFFIIGGSVLLRAMCGFEFISSVMVASEIPVFCKFLKAKKQDRKRWVKLAFWIGLSEIIAFMLAMIIWMAQELLYYRNWYDLWNDILTTVAKRTGFLQKRADIAASYQESLQAGRLDVVQEYLNIEIFLNKYSILWFLKWGMLSSMLVGGLAFWQKKYETVFSCLSDLLLVTISCLAPISWYFLASAHSYIHTHINPLLWLFPCLPLALALIGANLARIDTILGEWKCRSTTRSS